MLKLDPVVRAWETRVVDSSPPPVRPAAEPVVGAVGLGPVRVKDQSSDPLPPEVRAALVGRTLSLVLERYERLGERIADDPLGIGVAELAAFGAQVRSTTTTLGPDPGSYAHALADPTLLSRAKAAAMVLDGRPSPLGALLADPRLSSSQRRAAEGLSSLLFILGESIPTSAVPSWLGAESERLTQRYDDLLERAMGSLGEPPTNASAWKEVRAAFQALLTHGQSMVRGYRRMDADAVRLPDPAAQASLEKLRAMVDHFERFEPTVELQMHRADVALEPPPIPGTPRWFGEALDRATDALAKGHAKCSDLFDVAFGIPSNIKKLDEATTRYAIAARELGELVADVKNRGSEALDASGAVSLAKAEDYLAGYAERGPFFWQLRIDAGLPEHPILHAAQS